MKRFSGIVAQAFSIAAKDSENNLSGLISLLISLISASTQASAHKPTGCGFCHNRQSACAASHLDPETPAGKIVYR